MEWEIFLILTMRYLFAILIFVSVHAQAQFAFLESEDTYYSRKEAQDDLLWLKEAIEKIHPAFGIYFTQAASDSLYRVLVSDLDDTVSYTTLYRKVSILTAAVKCGHTAVLTSNPFEGYDEGYIETEIRGDKIFILKSPDHNDSLNGYEVVSINNIAPKRLFSELTEYFPLDGYTESSRQIWFEKYGLGYAQMHFNTDTLSILLVHPTRLDSVWLLPETDFYQTHNYPVYRDAMYAGKSQAFWDKPVPWLRLDEFEGKDRDFYEDVFYFLKASASDTLVIDLRGNSGGSLGQTTQLLSYLANRKYGTDFYMRKSPARDFFKYSENPRAFSTTLLIYNYIRLFNRASKRHWKFRFSPLKRNHFDGKIIILQDGLSFSASSILATALAGQPNVEVWGEESGGFAFGCFAAQFLSVETPYSGISIRFPLFRIDVLNAEGESGRGVMPDYALPHQSQGLSREEIWSRILEPR